MASSKRPPSVLARPRALRAGALCLALALAATASEAGEYYVDRSHPQADDANPGDNPEAPWATLVHAVETVVAGDTVWVQGGTYTESNHTFSGLPVLRPRNGGTEEAPIAFRVTPGQSAVLDTWLRLDSAADYHIWDGFRLADGNAIRVVATTMDRNVGSIIENCEVAVGPTADGPGNHYDILLTSTDRPVVRNCLLRDAYYDDSTGPAAGVLMYDTRDAVIEHNEFRNNGCGIHDKAAGERNVLRYNRIDGMENCGIYITGFSCSDEDVNCGGQQIYQNVITDAPVGMRFGAGGAVVFTGLEIWNNTMYGVDSGLQAANTPGIRVWNNVVHAATISMSFQIEPAEVGQSDFSIFYPAARFVLNANSANEIVYDSLADWRDATGYDTASKSADAMFVDAPAGDFHLAAGSPARDAGREDGDPNSTVLHMGAYARGDEWLGAKSLDLNGDGRIDGTELSWIGRAFAICRIGDAGSAWWFPVDHNSDECVNGQDLAYLAGLWNCTVPDLICPER